MAEARELTEERMREIAAMPFVLLSGFIGDPLETETRGPSGRAYRMKTYAFWDMEPEESDLYVRVKVTGRGLRFFQRYFGIEVRGPEDDFKGSIEESVDVSATWTESLAFALLGLVVIALITPLFVGVAYLISQML